MSASPSNATRMVKIGRSIAAPRPLVFLVSKMHPDYSTVAISVDSFVPPTWRFLVISFVDTVTFGSDSTHVAFVGGREFSFDPHVNVEERSGLFSLAFVVDESTPVRLHGGCCTFR